MEVMKIYACPMHPDASQDKPGKCPKCGMDLKETDRIVQTYSCSEHPDVISDKPGKCAKCDMKFNPFSKRKNENGSNEDIHLPHASGSDQQ